MEQPQNELEDTGPSYIGVLGYYAPEVYRAGTRINLESFNLVHRWICEDAKPALDSEGRPKFLPRRFTSEEQAMQSRHVSGGHVYLDKTLAVRQAEMAIFVNPVT